jgi:hypothetical protein
MLELPVRHDVAGKVLAKSCIVNSKKLLSDWTFDLDVDISIPLYGDFLSSGPNKIAIGSCSEVEKAGDFVEDVDRSSGIEDCRVSERVFSD